VPRELVYCGPFSLYDRLPGDDSFTVGEAVLSPTRTYLPLIRDLLEAIPLHDLHGLIHCSGGGQSKIVKFGALGNRYVKDTPLPVPPLFQALKTATGQSWAECYAVYNMGWRLEAVVPPSQVGAALAAARRCGIDAQVVGRVESTGTDRREVVVRTPDGDVTYH
jgi:phosphoribosylformylglycinamidine cyclo-ligase